MVSYDDDEIRLSLQEFRALADYFLTAAETLCTRLMSGVEPRINLSQLQDKINDMHVGFSFASHGANQLGQKHMRLLTKGIICGCGCIVHNDNGLWNRAAVVGYLRTVDELEKAVVGGLHTIYGQAPRAEELLLVLLTNGPCGARGFFVWSGLIVYITRHHKAKWSTNREFYVARFLPARLSQAMAAYLVYVRPFADLLRWKVFSAHGQA